MKITTSKVTKVVLTELERLDPVTMILEDISVGKGKITISCYGKAWTAYWGAMGLRLIAGFIDDCDVDYLVNKLSTEPSRVVDYDEVSRALKTEVDRDTLAFYSDQLSEIYGLDWNLDLPTTVSSDYRYLSRIVVAMKEAVYLTLYTDSNNN